MRNGRAFWMTIPAGVLLLSGCVFSPTKDKPHEQSLYLPQSSPDNCLSNLQQAYIDKNLDEYIKLFSGDFRFVFSPEDAQDPTNPTPDQWGLDSEREVHQKMFESELTDKISLAFVKSVATSSDNEYPETYRVNLTKVELQLDTRAADGTPWIYVVHDGTATFYFKEYPEERASDGRTLWRIWRWEDQPVGTGKKAAPDA